MLTARPTKAAAHHFLRTIGRARPWRRLRTRIDAEHEANEADRVHDNVECSDIQTFAKSFMLGHTEQACHRSQTLLVRHTDRSKLIWSNSGTPQAPRPGRRRPRGAFTPNIPARTHDAVCEHLLITKYTSCAPRIGELPAAHGCAFSCSLHRLLRLAWPKQPPIAIPRSRSC